MGGGTGVAEIPVDKQEMKVYPVPAPDVVTVELPVITNLKNGRLMVCGLDGRSLPERTVISRKTRISLSGLSSGVYIIRFAGCNETMTAKIIKQ